jgi:Mg2+ and Co2+ transporter CorA
VKLKKYTGGFSAYVQEKVREEFGLNIVDTSTLYKRCLIVHKDGEDLIISEASANLSVNKSVERLQTFFQEGKTLGFQENCQLAMELFHASHLEISKRAKFLTEMIIIESLIDQKEDKMTPVIEFIEELISNTEKSTIDNSDKKTLINGLHRLKKKSISSSGKSLVKKQLYTQQYNGKSSEKFFEECYNIRGRMVHGNRHDITDKIASEFDRMVSDLIISLVKTKE